MRPLSGLRALLRNPVALERSLGIVLWLVLIAVLLTKSQL